MSTVKSHINVLVLYTQISKQERFDIVLEQLSANAEIVQPVKICHDLDGFRAELRSKPDTYHVIIVHQASFENELWREVLYVSKLQNKFSEVIVIFGDKSNPDRATASEILVSGCFAYFEHSFEPDVLLGYVSASKNYYDERSARLQLSAEINRETDIRAIACQIAERLKPLTNWDGITISLLNRRRMPDDTPTDNFYRTLLYTSYKTVNWNLLRPTDRDLLIDKFVKGEISRCVFPDPSTDKDIKELFNVDGETPNVKSWIVMVLRHAGEPIGLVTLDGYTEQQFNYGNVNEIGLEQIANQSAAALKNAERLRSMQRLSNALTSLDRCQGLNEVLEALAQQACELVEGLFSYIVVPDEPKTHLAFEAAWSHHHREKFIETLKAQVRFRHPGDHDYRPGFSLIDPAYNSLPNVKGLTTLAYEKPRVHLLEHHADNTYVEPDSEAKENYYPFVYSFQTGPTGGKLHRRITESDVAIPILDGAEVLGVINVEHEHPYAFTEEHLRLLGQLAEFAAIAIRNRTAQERVKNLFQLSVFPHNESISLGMLSEVFNSIARKVKDASNASFVTIFAVQDNRSFYLGISNEIAPEFIRRGARIGTAEAEGHTFWCIRNKQPVIIPDTAAYQKSPGAFKDILGQSYYRKNGSPILINEKTDLSEIKTVVCLPMLLTEKFEQDGNTAESDIAVGAIWMHFNYERNFSVQEINDFLFFARLAAVTARNEETLKLKALEAEIGLKRDKAAIAEELVTSATKFFELKGAAYYEYLPDKHRLSLVASNINPPLATEMQLGKGLAGMLAAGNDKRSKKHGTDYLYSQGYLHVPEYSRKKYAHVIHFKNDEENRRLGSVFGVRVPPDVKSEQPLGVFIVHDEIGRHYGESRPILIELARFTARHIAYIKSYTYQNGSSAPVRVLTPEERAAAAEARIERLLDGFVLAAAIVVGGIVYALLRTVTLGGSLPGLAQNPNSGGIILSLAMVCGCAFAAIRPKWRAYGLVSGIISGLLTLLGGIR